LTLRIAEEDLERAKGPEAEKIVGEQEPGRPAPRCATEVSNKRIDMRACVDVRPFCETLI
jgi:hypothetical protein